MSKTILLSQNGWEYTGTLVVEADTIELLPNVNVHGIALNNVLVVNGAKLTFDEEIKLGK